MQNIKYDNMDMDHTIKCDVDEGVLGEESHEVFKKSQTALNYIVKTPAHPIENHIVSLSLRYV